MKRTIEEWMAFLKSQIELEERKRSRMGVSLWVLITSLVALGGLLLATLFEIEHNTANALVITGIAFLFFVPGVLFFNILRLLSLLPQLNPMVFMPIDTRKAYKRKILPIIKIYIIILVLIGWNGLAGYVQNPGQIIVFSTLLFIYCIAELAINRVKVTITDFYESSRLNKIKIFLASNTFLYSLCTLINLVMLLLTSRIILRLQVVYYAELQMAYNYKTVLAAALVIILAILSTAIVYTIINFRELFLYEHITREAFLHNLSSDEIEDISTSELFGYSAMKTVNEEYANWVEKFLENIEKDKQDALALSGEIIKGNENARDNYFKAEDADIYISELKIITRKCGVLALSLKTGRTLREIQKQKKALENYFWFHVRFECSYVQFSRIQNLIETLSEAEKRHSDFISKSLDNILEIQDCVNDVINAIEKQGAVFAEYEVNR